MQIIIITMASGIRRSVMGSFMNRFSGFSDPKKGNVIVVQKSDDSLWGCLRSKPCVCAFVTFFLLEIIIGGVAAGIYFTQNDSPIGSNCVPLKEDNSQR